MRILYSFISCREWPYVFANNAMRLTEKGHSRALKLVKRWVFAWLVNVFRSMRFLRTIVDLYLINILVMNILDIYSKFNSRVGVHIVFSIAKQERQQVGVSI